MTRVRWTINAADDLARIVERIREDNPVAAQRVAKKIYTAVAELRRFPQRGRIGLADSTMRDGVPTVAVYCRLRNHRRPGAGTSHSACLAGLAIGRF
jgi:plasmid stabilization system protein ParE